MKYGCKKKKTKLEVVLKEIPIEKVKKFLPKTSLSKDSITEINVSILSSHFGDKYTFHSLTEPTLTESVCVPELFQTPRGCSREQKWGQKTPT